MRLRDYQNLVADRTAKISDDAHYYGSGAVTVGALSRIDHGVILTGDVTIGKRVHVAPYCILYGTHGITLEDLAGVGAFSVLHSESDDYSGASICSPLVPAKMRAAKKSGHILLRKFANCGTRTTVMPGVMFGYGAVAGAHSFVISDLEAYWIYAGTPAKKIKERRREFLKMAQAL